MNLIDLDELKRLVLAPFRYFGRNYVFKEEFFQFIGIGVGVSRG